MNAIEMPSDLSPTDRFIRANYSAAETMEYRTTRRGIDERWNIEEPLLRDTMKMDLYDLFASANYSVANKGAEYKEKVVKLPGK